MIAICLLFHYIKLVYSYTLLVEYSCVFSAHVLHHQPKLTELKVPSPEPRYYLIYHMYHLHILSSALFL